MTPWDAYWRVCVPFRSSEQRKIAFDLKWWSNEYSYLSIDNDLINLSNWRGARQVDTGTCVRTMLKQYQEITVVTMISFLITNTGLHPHVICTIYIYIIFFKISCNNTSTEKSFGSIRANLSLWSRMIRTLMVTTDGSKTNNDVITAFVCVQRPQANHTVPLNRLQSHPCPVLLDNKHK